MQGFAEPSAPDSLVRMENFLYRSEIVATSRILCVGRALGNQKERTHLRKIVFAEQNLHITKCRLSLLTVLEHAHFRTLEACAVSCMPQDEMEIAAPSPAGAPGSTRDSKVSYT